MLRGQVNLFKIFKKHGFVLKTDTTKYINGIIESPELGLNGNAEVLDFIERFIHAIDKENLKSNFLDLITAEKALQALTIEAEDEDEDAEQEHVILEVIGAFDIPKYVYNEDRKQFYKNNDDKSLFASADAKANLFRDRLAIILQRLKRNSKFCPPTMGQDTNYYKIVTIDSLPSLTRALGEDGEKVVLFGMLTQLEEGKYYLEDVTGKVPIDLSNARFKYGLFCENMMVLVRGVFTGELFDIMEIVSPPPEDKEESNHLYKSTNFFGGNTINSSNLEQLQKKEEKAVDASLIVLSDIWLDKPQVLEKLEVLFSSYNNSPPTAFLLIGNFTQEPYADSIFSLREHFEALANLLKKFPGLVQESQFIIVPGPRDPGSANILPRPPLPNTLVKPLKDLLKHVTFTTNPCRIRYCTQEIVVFREDLTAKMRRYCILSPNLEELKHTHSHLVRTVLEQSHLCPLPLHARPIYWGFDHSLRLYPCPDALILADKHEQYTEKYADVVTFNPGSFYTSHFNFMVYYFSGRQPEQSVIP